MRERIIKAIDRISNFRWNVVFWFNLISDKSFRQIFKQNMELENLYTNERCFIVGNGPSLRNQNLDYLFNEYVFTVNNMMLDSGVFGKLNSDFHVIIDPAYFNLKDNQEDLATIELLKQINSSTKKPVCFTLYEGKESFRKYGIENILNLRYLFQHKNVNVSMSKICLHKNMPTSQNVIQTAIYAAMYMGFKKIYLIGCDMTSLFLTFVAKDDGEKTIDKDFHAYKYSANEMTTMLRDSSKHDNEYMLYDYAKTFTIFKYIRKYAELNGIEILNATKGGGLDVFNRIRYESLFANN